jgi:hypothetical protein
MKTSSVTHPFLHEVPFLLQPSPFGPPTVLIYPWVSELARTGPNRVHRVCDRIPGRVGPCPQWVQPGGQGGGEGGPGGPHRRRQVQRRPRPFQDPRAHCRICED